MENFETFPLPRPSIKLYGETKVQIERCNDRTYMITRYERVGTFKWRPVGFAESFTREHVEYLYNVDLSQLE